jgi:hypothetical protein
MKVVEPEVREDGYERDELYKFKKTVSLARPFEVYLETEKSYMKYKAD